MNLERAILTVLLATPRAIPVPVITGELPYHTGQDHTFADVTAALKKLERDGEVIGTGHKDKGTVWKETAEGRLRLAS